MLVKMRPQYFDNFFLNLYPYVQPSMGHAKRPILLYIMTLGGEVDMPTFNKIKNILYAKVYLKYDLIEKVNSENWPFTYNLVFSYFCVNILFIIIQNF